MADSKNFHENRKQRTKKHIDSAAWLADQDRIADLQAENDRLQQQVEELRGQLFQYQNGRM